MVGVHQARYWGWTPEKCLWGQVFIHVCYYEGVLIKHLVCGLIGTRLCGAWMGESGEIQTFHPCLRSPEPSAEVQAL